MFGNRARYDWLVGKQPAQARYTRLSDVTRGVEVRMQLKAALSTTEGRTVTVSSIGVPTMRALLTAIPRVHEDDLLTQCFSLVSEKLFELIECPAVELPVESLAPTLLNPYALQVLEGENTIGRTGNLFTNAVVHISHKPFLPSAQAFELPLSGAGAFRLEYLSEVGVLCPDILHLPGIEKSVIGADGDIHDASIYSEDFPPHRLGTLFLYSSVEEECAISVGEGGRFNLPIEVLFVVPWQDERGFYPAADGSYAHFFTAQPDVYHPLHSRYPLVESNSQPEQTGAEESRETHSRAGQEVGGLK